jgi:hypothetical protein
MPNIKSLKLSFYKIDTTAVSPRTQRTWADDDKQITTTCDLRYPSVSGSSTLATPAPSGDVMC